MTENRFTDKELAVAKSVNLVEVARNLGFTPKKIGKYYTLTEMDSIRIYNRENWFRWSRKDEKGHNGGSQIDFLREFAGMDVRTAVFWLLDFTGYIRRDDIHSLKYQVNVMEHEKEEKKPFVLPKANADDYCIYNYLNKARGISTEVIDFFIRKGLIYESEKYHNVVFKGNDKDGITRFASMRGIYDHDGKKFRCDVAGNDKRYGFNIHSDKSDEIIVFEAAIDLMSYMDIFGCFDTNMLALGMLGDAPLETFLTEHPHIKSIRLCLDGDEPGRKTMANLKEKYETRGFEVTIQPPPEKYKDYNEWLVAAKRGLNGKSEKSGMKKR